MPDELRSHNLRIRTIFFRWPMMVVYGTVSFTSLLSLNTNPAVIMSCIQAGVLSLWNRCHAQALLKPHI